MFSTLRYRIRSSSVSLFLKFSSSAVNIEPITENSRNVKLKAKLNYEYLCDERNKPEIQANILRRKGVGDIDAVLKLAAELRSQTNCQDFWKADSCSYKDSLKFEQLENNLYEEAIKIPNKTAEDIIAQGDEFKVFEVIGEKKVFEKEPQKLEEIAQNLRGLRMENLGILTGPRSYYFTGPLAILQNALIKYTVRTLLGKGFQLVRVPDILYPDVIEACGMNTQGERTQVYSLSSVHGGQLCLSGTAEMSLAGMLAGRCLSHDQLPLRLMAVSRCYRAEISNLKDEKGLYRVFQFTKVEMFCVTEPELDQSETMFHELLDIQRSIFQELGLHVRCLQMPGHELGAPAYRKVDMEAWMYGREKWGEVSSASNCTDYQSRRLCVEHEARDGSTRLVHTLNGTACAVPRMVISLCETHQNPDGTVNVPQVLQKYMRGVKVLVSDTNVPLTKWMRHPKNI